MKPIFYVDRAMCGGDDLPPEFDLEEFCEVLQGKLSGVEVVAVVDRRDRAFNRDSCLVPDSVFTHALGEYCHQ